MSLIPTRRADRRGVASLELALAAPSLLLLMLGGFDLSMWIRVSYRLDAVTTQLGQVVSQCTQIDDPGDFDAFYNTAQQIAGKIDITTSTGGGFWITAIGNVQGNSVVLWQRHVGNPGFTSHFGGVGQTAILGNYQVPAGLVMIGTEAFSDRQPWSFSARLMNAAPTAPLYSVSSFLVRSSDPNQLSSVTAAGAGVKACAS